mmetsp:Transcript_13843/g.23775  ORF Transcript_13843/g.23775 Transcript_13843/m.23775 type:complete len:129 (-) Transcript_13843:930-1316(-)
MSHLTYIKTNIVNLAALKDSLTILGLKWEEGPYILKNNYTNTTSNVDIYIKQKNDSLIGFSWNGKEYQLVADLDIWLQDWSVEGFLQRITHQYAYQVVNNECKIKGFTNIEQSIQKDGSIQLVMQRWR